MTRIRTCLRTLREHAEQLSLFFQGRAEGVSFPSPINLEARGPPARGSGSEWAGARGTTLRNPWELFLETAETLFHLADELHEAWLTDDLGMPAEVTFDQVVSFHDMRAWEWIAFRIMITTHQPDVIRH
jgi:hypothetical protein